MKESNFVLLPKYLLLLILNDFSILGILCNNYIKKGYIFQYNLAKNSHLYKLFIISSNQFDSVILGTLLNDSLTASIIFAEFIELLMKLMILEFVKGIMITPLISVSLPVERNGAAATALQMFIVL